MARIRKRVHYADYRSELAETKALRQGGFEDVFWDEDELVDFPKESKRHPKKKRGCPDNDFKAHVYVWETETRFYYRWSDGLSTRSYEVTSEICCGCGKVARRRYKW